ncbi:MAG: iron chaperone [Chitinophagaceae bacterium]
MITTKPNNIDEYIAGYPKETQTILEQIRATIKIAAPAAEETISYGMPTFTVGGKYLVYFAACKNHIGLYPVPGGTKEFEKDFSSYKTSGKGAIQFPLNKPMPFKLISKIVKFRLKENLQKETAKKQVTARR